MTDALIQYVVRHKPTHQYIAGRKWDRTHLAPLRKARPFARVCDAKLCLNAFVSYRKNGSKEDYEVVRLRLMTITTVTHKEAPCAV